MTRSDLRTEDCDDADVGRLAKLHGDQTIGLGVPEGACCGGNRGSIVLLDDARYDILELFIQLREVLNAALDNLRGPLVDLVSLILDLVGTDDVVDGFLGDLLHVLRVKFVFVFEVCHILSLSISYLNYFSDEKSS